MMDSHGHEPASLREELQDAIDKLPPDTVSLGSLLEQFQGNGLLMLTAMMTLVFLIPVSIPGVSTVFGAGILMVGVARLFQRPVWLPERIRSRPLLSERLRPALERGLVWVRRLEKISKSGRLSGLVEGNVVGVINNLALILGAVLLMFPFGFIPFSNTLPGIALLCLAVGMMQRDGVAILLGHLGNVVTIVYFTFLLGGGGLLLQRLFT